MSLYSVDVLVCRESGRADAHRSWEWDLTVRRNAQVIGRFRPRRQRLCTSLHGAARAATRQAHTFGWDVRSISWFDATDGSHGAMTEEDLR
jgi:hypothetical protein